MAVSRKAQRGGKARLYEDGVFPTADGTRAFVTTTHTPTAEKTDARYPLHFNTGRLRDQWHGMSRTGTVARLFNHAEEPLLAMHARDMERRRLAEGRYRPREEPARRAATVRVEASDAGAPGTDLPRPCTGAASS